MALNFEITGSVHSVFPVERVTDGFRKKEFWIEHYDGYREQIIKFESHQDYADMLENWLKKDIPVKVKFHIRGRVWQDKCFTNLIATTVVNEQKEAEVAEATIEPEPEPEGEMDDLPF